MQPTPCRSRFSRSLFGYFGILVLLVVASSSWAFDENEPTAAKVGLQGVLPDQIPQSLSADALSDLDGNWADWSKSLAELVGKLYQADGLDVAGQRQVIKSLRAKIGVLETALQDNRYQSIFDKLVSLRGELIRRVETSEAALDTLEQSPATRVARLDATRHDLENSIRDLRGFLAPMKNGEAWLKYLRTTELEKLTADPKSSDGSIPLMLSVQRKFETDGNATTASQRNFLDRAQFSRFKTSLNAYLRLVRAVNNTDTDGHLRTALASLLGALDRYESSNSSSDAVRVRAAFSELSELAPDAGDRMSKALRSQYFNYNLRVVVSENFFNKVIGDNRTENGPVDDFILGAKVDGRQTTNTKVALDMRPNADGARLRITLQGVSQTSTQGVTDQATIFTSGYHTFYATKDVVFNGTQFVAEPARISVNANNTTTGARTQLNNVPILGSFAQGIAVNEAQRKRSESEAIARQRVSSRVVPRFNQEVDANFQDANEQLEQKLNAPLKELGLYPSAIGVYSTDSDMRLRTRLMGKGELGADTPISKVTSSTGFVVHLHESLMNNSVDRMQLAGRTLTEQELARELEEPLGRILGREVKFDDGASTSDDEPASFIFHSSDPIRFRVRGGLMELTIQAGLRSGEGKEDIPTQIITVPLSFNVVGENVVIERGAVIVSAVEPPKSQFVQIARAGAVRKKVESALPNRELDRYISLEVKEGKNIDTGISEIKALDGWLSIAFE